MRRHSAGLILGSILGLATIAGCAASAPRADGVDRDPDLISAEEVRTANQTDAYALVRAARPQWLRYRGGASTNSSQNDRGKEVVVYLDGTRHGGTQSLRQIPLTIVSSIRYLDPNAATQRYGTGHGMGAILVSTH